MMRTTITQAAPPRLDRRGVLLLAAVCGVAVGNVYFPQAVSPSIAAGLHARPAAAAGIVTATQLGYALGLFALVPLGDRIRHRRLAVSLLVVTGCWLLAAAAAPDLGVLLAAGTLVGVSTVVAPVIGPMAAGLVAERRRGAVSGALLSGALGGMLLSRALGGPLSQWLGWRAGYLAMALLTLACAVLASRTLPATAPTTSRPYPSLLAQSVAALAGEPELRRSSFYQATVFAAFSAVWTGVALLLTGPVYRLGASAVGLLALVNAATMVSTPVAGRWADRRGPDAVNLVAMLGVVAAAAVLAAGALGGAGGMAALVAGTLLLDVAMQAGMVANQVRNYRLRPQARSRVNTAYMTCAYGGGAAGSWLGARAFGGFGWLGVCAVAAVLAGAALARHARWRVRSRVSGLSAAARPRQPAAGAVSGHAGTVAGMTATTTPGPADAIVARGLIKRFGATTAVDGIDLTIAAGTVFGLLGPNGAGKTTIVNILATLVVPDDGQASVHGYDVITQAHRVRQLIGLTGQYASVDETLTGTENLVLIGRLTGASRKDAKERARELLARFRLADAAGRAVKTYSGGMRRRLDLAASLVPGPRVLFLDEPTTGLDPRSRNELWDIVRGLVGDGVTVLLTTQYLEEADQLADRIAVIDQGRVIAQGTSADLKALTGADTLDAVFLALTGHDTKEAQHEEDDLEEVSA